MKKPLFKRWWFWPLLVVLFVIVWDLRTHEWSFKADAKVKADSEVTSWPIVIGGLILGLGNVYLGITGIKNKKAPYFARQVIKAKESPLVFWFLVLFELIVGTAIVFAAISLMFKYLI